MTSYPADNPLIDRVLLAAWVLTQTVDCVPADGTRLLEGAAVRGCVLRAQLLAGGPAFAEEDLVVALRQLVRLELIGRRRDDELEARPTRRHRAVIDLPGGAWRHGWEYGADRRWMRKRLANGRHQYGWSRDLEPMTWRWAWRAHPVCCTLTADPPAGWRGAIDVNGRTQWTGPILAGFDVAWWGIRRSALPEVFARLERMPEVADTQLRSSGWWGRVRRALSGG